MTRVNVCLFFNRILDCDCFFLTIIYYKKSDTKKKLPYRGSLSRCYRLMLAKIKHFAISIITKCYLKCGVDRGNFRVNIFSASKLLLID